MRTIRPTFRGVILTVRVVNAIGRIGAPLWWSM